MRFTFLAALALAACGGGSGTTTRTAALQGLVYEVDGQTLDRSGVTVRVLETGAAATTGADGRFFFPGVPADAFTLGFGAAALAQSGPGGGSDDPPGDDNGGGSGGDDDLAEDEDGNPMVGGVPADDTVEVRVATSDGEIVEMSVSCSDRLRSEARLTRDASSPDADVKGKVRIESRPDREKLTIEAEHLDPGTVVEFLLDGTSVGTAAALADGEAEIEFNTKDGDALPLGAAAVADLAGLPVEVRLMGTGELLLAGEVPSLPDATVVPGSPGSGSDRSRGRASLVPLAPGLDGHVEIRRRPDEQRFKMEAEGLAPGTVVAFRIEESPGSFVKLRSVVADSGGEAEISTQDDLPMPLGVADVGLLSGLGVRVTLDDGSDEVLLEGRVPPLVAD